ncbi:hypothetical protein [Xenorhabdus bovienii]|uniref:hypothetical protein n=1 Tax=Xenorhabdus bovienii TaxID=40576 RepID=UPI0023B22896|nr:hypothetical protein [Xenorhabdus bovienii]
MVKKIMLLAFAAFLGAGIVMLVQWMRPPTEDPYFFLNPKVTEDHPIEIPIKLYKKGEKIDLIFWKTPLPKPKLLYLFPGNAPTPHIMLKIKELDKSNLGFYVDEIFEGKGPIPKTKDIPVFDIKIYKINDNLTESLLYEKIHTGINFYSVWNGNYTFSLVDFDYSYKEDHGYSYEYGQYRLQVEVLADWPELEMDDLSYSIYLETHYIK